jgi:hypothetical protein
MATIRGLLRGGRGDSGGIVQHTVGNALVLHQQDAISSEAQSLALSVIEDPENDVVVLDLGDGMPIGSWESMAGVLPRRRRGIRLVACGENHNAAGMAGQWLSERLNRTVIAPDGDLIRGSAGALFVHSKPGSGWVRFRPGKPPAWDAKRYPAPLWDAAATERRTSSSTGEIEPLPGGVWIHDVRNPEVVAEHRRRLVADVPCRPDTMTVLLGCPGTAPLSLDDVVRFWRELDPDTRLRTRFVQYGDIRMPEGESFGQTLADLFDTSIVCYTGVPIGAPGKFEIRTVRADGVLGWPPFALELGYTPRAHPNSRARRPALLSHRAPLKWTEEIAPRVYWYAPDAVVEVVQAGLWIRPAQEPANAERVRSTPLDAEGSTLIFDDTADELSERMRELAVDLAARVDRSVGEDSALYAASALVPGQKQAGRAHATLTFTAETMQVPEIARESPTVIASVPAPIGTASVVNAVVAEPVPAPQVDEFAAFRQFAPALPPEQPVLEPAPEQPVLEPAREQAVAPAPEPEPEPVPEPVALQQVQVPVAPPAPQQFSVQSTIDSPAEITEPVAIAPAPVEPAPMEPAPTEPAPTEPAPTEPAPTEPAPVEAPPGATAPVEPVVTEPVAIEIEPPVEPPVEQPEPPEPAATGIRPQPVPSAKASALLPSRGLEEERTWLRRSLSRDFDTMASSVSRLMSEHPGMKASGSTEDLVVDSVALRLYLTRRGTGIDAGLSTGANGPHVPFARCAVSGLSRMPSFRGATIVRASPTPADWAFYTGRRLVTDWSFVNMLAAPCSGQDGDTDVLIWSMTARRTGLLEPEGDERVEDRVVFLPGTSFKILECTEPAGDKRGAILLREIGANEIDEDGRVDQNRVSLDELAVASLRRSVERWAGAGGRKRIGTASAGRFGVLPGLVRQPVRDKG